jgi:hypothetical protein
MNLHSQYGLIVLALHASLSSSAVSKNSDTLENLVLVFRSILCCIAFYYKLHISVNMMVCFGAMLVSDVASKHYNTSLANRHDFMQLVATYYMIENMTTAYSPLFVIQITSWLKESIMTPADWEYIYSLAIWLNLLAVIDTNLSFIILMNAFCNFMYHWQFVHNMNRYAGWLVVFGTHYLLKNSIIIYVDDYINTFDIFYIYLLKYFYIIHMLNYFHLKFKNDHREMERDILKPSTIANH